MFDMLIHNARVRGQADLSDIAISSGKIVEIRPAIEGDSIQQIDAQGYLVCPPFIDSHFHLDSALTYGQPRVNRSGTLLEGIRLWGELKPDLTSEKIYQRVKHFLQWSIARGTLVIRSHVDISDPSLAAVEALLALRKDMCAWLDIQLVAFPQDGFLRLPGARENLLRALDMGVDVVGGIPHFERSMADGAESVRQLCEIAETRGLLVDMHCDESDDPLSRHVESLAYETQRLGMQGRVTGSHLTSMHSMDNYYVSKLIPLLHETDLQVVANPLINISLQGRHDSYPKRRGMTRVKELSAAGLNVAFGHDCVLDPWYSLGSHDMLEVAHMGLHVGQMTGSSEMMTCFDAVTTNAARCLQIEGYGIRPGCNADLLILQCRNEIDALRLKPARLWVIRQGKVIASCDPVKPKLLLADQKSEIDFELLDH